MVFVLPKPEETGVVMGVYSDEYLVYAYQSGDQQAFKKLFQKYYQYVFKVFVRKGVSGCEAEDFAQDLFLKMLFSLQNFKGESRFKTYLDRAIAYKLIDFYRKLARRNASIPDAFNNEEKIIDKILSRQSEENRSIPLNLLERKEFREQLKKCIRSIKNEMARTVLIMSLEGFSLSQITTQLNLPAGTANSYLTRSKKHLRICLKKNGYCILDC